jgi:hypothetical protein
VIVLQAGSLLTLKKTFRTRHIKYAKRVLEEDAYNATSDALKISSREEDPRRRNPTEVESQRLIYKRGSVIPFTSGHTPARAEGKTMTATATATSWQPTHQHHSPQHNPGDALGSRDPMPPAFNPRSRRLPFRRACLHDIHGGARTWRHHRSARSRHAMSRHSSGGRMKKKRKDKTRANKTKRTTMEKGLPRGEMTIRVGTVVTV